MPQAEPASLATQSEVVTVHTLDQAAAAWEDLAARSENIFASLAWARLWRQHLAPEGELAIGLVRRAGEASPCALIPLSFRSRGPLRLGRFIGAGPADELGLVCAAADRALAAPAAGDYIRQQLGSGLFLAERLWGEHPWPAELQGSSLRREPSPVLPLEGQTFEDFLASRSRNFRSQLGRFERQLTSAHRLSYRLTEDPECLKEDLDRLISLHAARWGENSSAFQGARRAFHLDFARTAMDRGWLRLWTMELDGSPVAAWYGFRYAGIETYYQAGRDPRLERLRVGTVLLAHTIRSACEDGMREYRFGLGGEDYKSRFTQLDPGLDTLALPVGMRGGAALRALRTVLRLPPERRAALSRWL